MRYTDLKKRECVSTTTGERLGFITDVIIDENKGLVTHLVIGEKRKISMRKDTEEHVIDLQEIETVGEDVLIVALKNNQRR